MRFSYRIIREKSAFIAECVESDAAGEGETRRSAVEALRRALEERMFRPDAVAPPSAPTQGVIELVLVDGNSDASELASLELDDGGAAPSAPKESEG